jgi:hypothetical protein
MVSNQILLDSRYDELSEKFESYDSNRYLRIRKTYDILIKVILKQILR